MPKFFASISIIVLVVLSVFLLRIAHSRTDQTTEDIHNSIEFAAHQKSGWQPERRLTRTPGESRTSINFARSIAADEAGRVHLVWREQDADGTIINYKRSPDGGVSWSPAIRLGSAPGSAESGNPGIAVSGNAVHVAWWREMPQSPPQIWYKHSPDGGITWETERAITNSPSPAAFCSLAAWGSSVHLVYVDQRDGNAEVYYTRSIDEGAAWSAAVRLSSLPHNSYTPTIAVWKSNVYVAWTDTRDFGKVTTLEEEYFRRSTDGGKTFEPEQRLTNDSPESPANSWASTLAAHDQFVWITWFDDRSGNFEIYTKRSTDAGVSWSPDTRLTTTSTPSFRPSITLYGQNLLISYWDGDVGSEEIYALRSNDLGATWSAPERLSYGNGSSVFSSAAASSTGFHVVWTDSRDQNAEIYYEPLPGNPARVGNGRIAFTKFLGNVPQIFTVARDGTDERKLTFDGANQYPAWSKDGTKIAFSSNRSGEFEIWTMNPDGTDPQQITNGEPGGSFVPDWSYDGTRIAYAYLDPVVGHPEVWVMNANGTQQTRLTNTPPSGSFTWSLHPTWEPGDERIYYASTASGTSQVWGMYSNGLGQEQKTNGLGPDAPNANATEFGRDGRLAFWAGFEGQYGEVWVWDSPGNGSPRRITSTADPFNSDNPAWSPDGTKLLFDSNQSSPDGGVNIWSINLDGSNLKLFIPGGSGLMSWQPVFSASVNVSGRVTNQSGRGVATALIVITDETGNSRYAFTNPFGYYRFKGIATGQHNTISVRSKRYPFTSRIINVSGEITNIDFIAEP